MSLEMESVPVIIADDLSPQQIKAFRLADNKTSELSEWDQDKLMEEINSMDDTLDMSDFGFDFGEENVDTQLVKDDDFEPKIPDTPKSKPGDMYQLGKHILMCGDSTSEKDVMKLSGESTVDLLITDPPYNVDYEGKAGKIKNDKMGNNEFLKFISSAMKNASTSLKPGGSFYVWYSDSETMNFREACEKAGMHVRECLMWVKNAFVLGRQDYQHKHEPCLYGWKDDAAHKWYGGRRERTTITGFDIYELRNMKKDDLLKWVEEYWCNNDEYDTTVLYENRPVKSDLHPTMKPIPLIARQIKNSSKSGDIVMDLFGGSGTTMMACEQLGRSCRTMEYDPKFVDVIIDRWEKYTGNKAVKIK